MIISYILSKFEGEQRDNIVSGLAIGLAFGLVFGLAIGLAFGLVFGLAIGLAFGLAIGLASGLASGLAFGLAFELAFGLVFGLVFVLASGLASGILSPLWIGIIAILIIAEFLFIIDKSQPTQEEKKHLLWYTVIHKGEGIIEAAILIVNAANLIRIAQSGVVTAWFSENSSTIMKVLGGIGLVVIGAIVLFGWIWLNSRKYSTSKKKTRGR